MDRRPLVLNAGVFQENTSSDKLLAEKILFSDEFFKTRNNSGSSIASFKIVKATGHYNTENIITINSISALTDIPVGITTASFTDVTTADILQKGILTVTGFNTTGSAIGNKVYCNVTGDLTLTETDILVGIVLTLAANGIIFFNTDKTKLSTGGGGSAWLDDDGTTPSPLPSATGSNSIAIGEGAAVQSGSTDSFAVGSGALVQAASLNSIAIGKNSYIGYIGSYPNAASNSIAIGTNANVKRVYNAYQEDISNGIAIGNAASVLNNGGISIGAAATSFTNSIAIGNNASNSSTISSIAIGQAASSVNSGVAIGETAVAGNSDSIAIGKTALCLGASGVSIGSLSYVKNTLSIRSISIGLGKIGSATRIASSSIAIGNNATVLNTAANLYRGIAIGNVSLVSGSDGIAIGSETTAGTGGVAHAIAIGYRSVASAYKAISIGIGNLGVGATGTRAIAIGHGTSAGTTAVAIGSSSTASTDGVAIGRIAVAGTGIAIGPTATVGNSYGIAIGRNTSAAASFGVALGNLALSTSDRTIAIGHNAQALNPGQDSIAIGSNTLSNSSRSISIGASAQSTAITSIAFGDSAISRIRYGFQVQATPIIRKDEAVVLSTSFALFKWGTSSESIITTKEIDLKTAATTTIDVPTGSRFYVTEVGLILTTRGTTTGLSDGTITTQPIVSFGITGTPAKFVALTTSVLSTIYERDKYDPLTTEGETSLTFTVGTIAAGSLLVQGRAYFKGVLMETQV